MSTGTLKLPKKPVREPRLLRYIDRKGRYILQEREAWHLPWQDVPLVGSEEPAVVVRP